MSVQRLLLVEDDVFILLATQDALEEAGYIILTASNPADAVVELENSCNDLVALVTDVNLGRDGDGWQVARHARKLMPLLPVLYATANGADNWPANGVPGSVVVEKPYHPTDLIQALSDLLRQRHS